MISITQWLDAEEGRSKALADYLHITGGRMSQIKASGFVPASHRDGVLEFTGGEVSVESMLTNSERESQWVTRLSTNQPKPQTQEL